MVEEKKKNKSPIEKISQIFIPEEQAKIEWKKYNELLKKRKDKHLQIIKQAMYFAKQGKTLIDIYETIKKGGLNKNNEPRLAIARADLHEVYLEKQDTGTICFNMKRGDYSKDNVTLPQKSFNIQWERQKNNDGTEDRWRILNKELKTKVPIIPAEIMPNGDLSNYYVLWEVKEWEKLPEIKDPFLLKRISENMFVILGAWDITELERAIIGGLK